MPSRNPRDPKSTEQPVDAMQLEDLKHTDVSEQESARVKGGLNPQPLPPGMRLY